MAAATAKGVTGTIPFKVPGIEKECWTWYRIFGDLDAGVRPLICLHGGPGVAYVSPLSNAALRPKTYSNFCEINLSLWMIGFNLCK